MYIFVITVNLLEDDAPDVEVDLLLMIAVDDDDDDDELLLTAATLDAGVTNGLALKFVLPVLLAVPYLA